MKDTKDLPKDLPSMETELSLDIKGNVTGKRWNGTFKYRIPNIKARAIIDKKRAELNGPIEEKFLDPSVAMFHFMIAYLRGTLDFDTLPKWWKDCDFGYELHDSNVVEELFRLSNEFEKNWMIQVWGPEEGAETPNPESKDEQAKGA